MFVLRKKNIKEALLSKFPGLSHIQIADTLTVLKTARKFGQVSCHIDTLQPLTDASLNETAECSIPVDVPKQDA